MHLFMALNSYVLMCVKKLRTHSLEAV